VLKVTAQVAAPGAESAVCDCLVRLMRGAGMGNSKAPVFAAAVKLARKPQIISLYWAYSATPLALGVRVCVKSSTRDFWESRNTRLQRRLNCRQTQTMQYVQYTAEARIIAAQQQQQQRECVARDSANVRCIHRDSKNKTLNSCPYIPQMLTDFQNSVAN